MNNPFCPVCGHVNRVGAVACEMCDARMDTTGSAFADEPLREPFGDASEPFASTAGPSWTASDTGEPSGAWSPPTPADDIPAPPFKGAGDVVSPMLAVYRKHFVLVGILVLVTTVPEALLQYGFLTFASSGGLHGGAMGVAVASGVVIWLMAMAGAALLSGSLVYAVVDVQRAARASAGECLARGLKALPKVYSVSLLYALVTVIGYVMLIVPGVIFSLMFAVCIPAAIIEGLGPIDALKRSQELTKGYKGLIFMTFFLWGLLITVLSWIVTWSFTNNTNLDMLPMLLLQTAVQGMLTSTSHVLTVYIYLGLLREHRSGFGTNTFTSGPAAAAR